MFHGNITPAPSHGIKALRERNEKAKIPPSRLDETLNL
jgi:hypothetical protein